MKAIQKFLNKENFLLISIFLFILAICSLTPIVGDDWKNYIVSSSGMKAILDGTISMYMTWEGRIGSRFLIYFLTSHKIIYDLIVALFTTLAIYFVGQFVQKKQRYIVYLLCFASILLCSRKIFLETYLYVAGGITYLFPTMLFIGYLYYYFKVLSKRSAYWYEWILLFLFSMVLPTFVEHVGVAFVVINFVLFIYHSYQNKRIDYLFLSIFLLSLISSLAVVMSPGNTLRNKVDGTQISMIRLILRNYRNFIYYTFTINAFLLILMNAVYVIYINRYVQRNFMKIVAMIFAVVPSSFITILQTLHDFGIITLYLQNNFIVIFYFILYASSLLFLFIKIEKKKEYYLLLIASLLPNLAMMASPIWGGRTTFTTVILLSFLCILLIFKDRRHNSIFTASLTIVMAGIAILYSIIYINLYSFVQYQKKEIKEHMHDDSICVYQISEHVIAGLVPYDEYHIDTYKEYYHIPVETQLKYCKKK